jgi:hypothetical protein
MDLVVRKGQADDGLCPQRQAGADHLNPPNGGAPSPAREATNVRLSANLPA